MIEIVFNNSACGSLKMAQHYGKGKFSDASIGIMISDSNDSKPNKSDIKAARKEASEKAGIAWENALPLGGKASDVFSLHLSLSIGDISEDNIGLNRRQVFRRLFCFYKEDEALEAAKELFDSAVKNLKTIRERVESGETIRIWFSNQPDDICGLYWFMSQLIKWKIDDVKLVTIKLPDWEAEGDIVIQYSGWGEVSPEKFSGYLELQKPLPHSLIQSYAHRWRGLQKENADLRALINGQLQSVAETLYDSFITREIEAEDEEFNEAKVIGRVIGKYNLGIGDAWLAERIEEMIKDGKLLVLSTPEKDMPIYHKRLKKP